jgi:hypothetical protein
MTLLGRVREFRQVLAEVKKAKQDMAEAARLEKEILTHKIYASEDLDLVRLQAFINQRKGNDRIDLYFPNGTRMIITTQNGMESQARGGVW